MWTILVSLVCLLFAACSDSTLDDLAVYSTPSSAKVVATATATIGSQRTNPAPWGHTLSHEGLEITVQETTYWRNEQRLYRKVTREGHITGETVLHAPHSGEGNKWLVIGVKLRNAGDPNKVNLYGPTQFKVVGASGTVYEVVDFPPRSKRKPLSFERRGEDLLGIQFLDSGEFFGGAELEGSLMARVAQDDGSYVLVYSIGPEPTNARYLSLEPSETTEGTFASEPSTSPQTWPVPPLGTGRTNPTPFGAPFEHNDVEITVLQVAQLAREGASFAGMSLRTASDAGYHYIGVKLRLRNVGDPNETQTYSKDHFWVTGKLGLVYDEVFTPDRGELRLSHGEFFGGGEVTGAIAVQVLSDDEEFVLIYSPPPQGGSFYSLDPTDN